MNLNKLVMFCILMENMDGINGKSPGYIVEKFNLYSSKLTEDEMFGCLDSNNQAKYLEWKKLWLR